MRQTGTTRPGKACGNSLHKTQFLTDNLKAGGCQICFSVFLLPVNFFPLSQVASVAFLPSGLLLSDFRSCQLGILASADAATGSTLLRGLENESPQQQSFFQGSLRFDEGVTVMGIIFDFGMPVQHAFDAPFRLEPGQV
jgi:hypothetical protein